MSTQIYEKYWKLTLEYTDFHDEKFLKTLQYIVDKIDMLHTCGTYHYNRLDYQALQEEILAAVPKTSAKKSHQLASTRKAINQCVKLGFINPFLQSYHENTKDYLNAKSNRKRNTLLSKIVYSNAKFNCSLTQNHDWSQINFLIKTLEETGSLSQEEIVALMLVDLSTIGKGYVTKEELARYVSRAREIGFTKRKYNQIGYLKNLLKKLDEIVFVKNMLFFAEDTDVVLAETMKTTSVKRDGYLHFIYKNQLKEESSEQMDGKVKCMLENLAYPSLVASHIKPFSKSNEQEAYDPNNGLLLSRSMDILFDRGYITFKDDGTLMCSPLLDSDVISYLARYRLNPSFINTERRKYLHHHRTKEFKKKL